jgi:hypothetical protein
MISGKDITVAVPCAFEDTRPIWMMETSCRKHGLSLKPYSMGEVYNGWTDLKIYKLRQEALNCPTSHILYTDARDAWFLAGPDEIAGKYNAYGAPPLMLSAQCDVFGTYAAWYRDLPWDMSKIFRYIGTPGQLCQAKALAEALLWMQENYKLGNDFEHSELPDDDPPWWCEFIRHHPGVLKLDTECSIFMNAGSRPADGEMFGDVLEFRDGRVYNKLTTQSPCVLHFNGGYSHALHGKWERLEPFWKACGYTERPPWEAK